jgi:putative endonuclease
MPLATRGVLQNLPQPHRQLFRKSCDIASRVLREPVKTFTLRHGDRLAPAAIVQFARRFVYIIQSTRSCDRYYCGLTSDVRTRLDVHNSGGSTYTSSLRPWRLVAAIEFSNAASAVAFEKYLKTGSGRAFAKRHFV